MLLITVTVLYMYIPQDRSLLDTNMHIISIHREIITDLRTIWQHRNDEKELDLPKIPFETLALYASRTFQN